MIQTTDPGRRYSERRVRLNISDAGNVVVIVCMTPVMAHIVIFDPLVIKFAQDLFRCLAQFDTQMVNQL